MAEGLLLVQALKALEDRDGLAGANLNDGLLPRPGGAACDTAPLGLGFDVERAHLDHVHVEQRFDGLADLGAVCVGLNAEGFRAGRREHIALLGKDRLDDHLGRLHHALSRWGAAARAVNSCKAFSETSKEAAPSKSATPTLSGWSTATRARLRKDSAAADSSTSRTTKVGWDWFQPSSRSKASLVLGALKTAASRIAIDPRSAWRGGRVRREARCSLRLTLKV